MSAVVRTWLLAALAASSSACLEAVVLGDGRSPRDAAAGDDAMAPDASDPELDLPRFAEPVLIEALATGDDDADDDDPSLDAALTLLFFNSTRDGGSGREDIWFSRREGASDAWSAPEPAVALNSDARETGTALSEDGLTIYWSSDREGGAGGLDVYVSERATLHGAWSEPRAVAAVNTRDDDLISAVADGGRTLLLARRAGDSSYALWWARRADAGDGWSEPEPIDVADSRGAESDPFVTVDGTALLFTREGDLQLATRSAGASAFGAARALSTLNSEDDDSDPWSDAQLRYVVFASARGGESRLYEARRINE